MYLSLPIAYTAPSRLAALAALHGLDAPAPTTASVIELGCASGGNLVPLAVRFPKSTFAGVDLDATAINEAKRRAAALNATNLDFQQADLSAIPLHGEPFDYIICHGVFSWVPPPVRAHILALCASRLAPNGLAAISFNVLPGWRIQQIIRDLCLRQSTTGKTDAERVATARAFLEKTAKSLTDATPYGLAVRQAAKRLAVRPDSYLLGEFLAPHNEAFFFDDFAASARNAGLKYVCDGEFSAPSGQSDGDLDASSGRTFRRAILSKAEPSTLCLSPSAMRGLHFTCSLHPQSDGRFRTVAGRTIQLSNPAGAKILEPLIEAFPGTVSFADLMTIGEPFDLVARALLGLASAQHITMSATPTQVGRAKDARPRAFSLPRVEAANGQKWVSSLAHRAVPVDAASATLITLMDGSRDTAALRAGLARSHPEAEARFDDVLRALEREALIEPSDGGRA